jgi:hypothetical protein
MLLYVPSCLLFFPSQEGIIIYHIPKPCTTTHQAPALAPIQHCALVKHFTAQYYKIVGHLFLLGISALHNSL